MPSKTTLFALSLVPVVVPAVYLAVVQASVSRQIASIGTSRRILSKKDRLRADTSTATVEDAVPPKSIPDYLLYEDVPYVVTCERVVTKPIAAAALTDPILLDADASDMRKTSFLLSSYLRGSMLGFASAPPGRTLQHGIADVDVLYTFSPGYVQRLAFVAGDRACGAYQVTYRAGAEGNAALSRDRVELSIVPLEDQPQLNVHGVVVVGIERTPAGVVFVNEAWMWRHATEEEPTMIEGAFGRWLHGLFGGWMILKGTRTLTAGVQAKSDKWNDLALDFFFSFFLLYL